MSMKKNRAKENRLKKKYGLDSKQVGHRSSISGNKRMHRFVGRVVSEWDNPVLYKDKPKGYYVKNGRCAFCGTKATEIKGIAKHMQQHIDYGDGKNI